MSHTKKINSIFVSRKTILELLDTAGYNVDDYQIFLINEVDAMYKTSQLDMLLHHRDEGKKVYIKYYLPDKQKQIQKNVLDDIVEDLFVIENVLNKSDTLIIIMDDEPNEATLSRITYMYEKEGIFVVIHNMKRLQFNILKHDLVPPISILNDEEASQFMKEQNIQRLNQLPEISRFDPQALAICLRPNQICKIERNSPTAAKYWYYRVCV
jgi:DNA-directed RNA polymerase subunit H (RpoH/RPB5)